MSLHSGRLVLLGSVGGSFLGGAGGGANGNQLLPFLVDLLVSRQQVLTLLSPDCTHNVTVSLIG